jgi:serine protease Do
MSSGLVIHIAVGDDKHTEVLAEPHIKIGTGEECDLKLRSPEIQAATGTLLELERTNGHYQVTSYDSSVLLTHNGNPISTNAVIENGDKVHIGETNVALQFFPIQALPNALSKLKEPIVAPFIEQAAIESAATARRDDAKVFLREFTRELLREINVSTKIITLAIIITLVAGTLYLGFGLYNEIQKSRKFIDEVKNNHAVMATEIKRTNDEIIKLIQSNDQLRNSLSFAAKVYSDYGNGVCMISGTYLIVDAVSGKPLRYPENKVTEENSGFSGGEDPFFLTIEGNGPLYENEFVGTGFHVGDGYVLTNRHIAQPWEADDKTQAIIRGNNARGRLTKLLAFFPERRHPIEIRVRQVSPQEDLAVCLIEDKNSIASIPVLPLDKGSEAVAVGKMVVMMGYPTGPGRFLATLPPDEAQSARERYSSLESLMIYLADRKLIRPLTTSGHITDLASRRVIYDAQTSEGGSGAPVFGTSGRVIGVNYAILPESTASNFSVSIRYAIALLQQSGWQPPNTDKGMDPSNQQEQAGS